MRTEELIERARLAKIVLGGQLPVYLQTGDGIPEPVTQANTEELKDWNGKRIKALVIKAR